MTTPSTMPRGPRSRSGTPGPTPVDAYGGIPFPIPKTGAQVMWNHQLHWRGEDWHFDVDQYLGTADGRLVLSTDGQAEQAMPYYYRDKEPTSFNGEYWLLRLINVGAADPRR